MHAFQQWLANVSRTAATSACGKITKIMNSSISSMHGLRTVTLNTNSRILKLVLHSMTLGAAGCFVYSV